MRETRREIVEQLENNLIGPLEGNDEITKVKPTIQYSGGILYPSNMSVEGLSNEGPVNAEAVSERDYEEQDDFEQEESGQDEVDHDDIVPIPVQMNRPASIGLACIVPVDLKTLRCEYSYGRYTEISSDENEKKRWHRKHCTDTFDIPIKDGADQKELDEHQFRLEWIIKKRNEYASVHVFLVNRRQTNEEFPPIEEHVFQPKIVLEATDSREIFMDMEIHTPAPSSDPDIESFRMLYRNKGEFATGHNCAVMWNDPKSHLTDRVYTTFMPQFELPATSYYEIPDMKGLDMKILKDAQTGEEYEQLLDPLLRSYSKWIKEREKEAKSSEDIKNRYEQVATRHLKACHDALDRMKEGVRLIENDKNVRDAFRFANEVMLYQRSYSVWAADYRQSGKRAKEPTIKAEWRPFQLAFILLNIGGISNSSSPDRELVDLLWFPTGGGKTEAYLGVAAFAMGLRRLNGSARRIETYAGTSVLMRYTLRLLTIQQFQRAATMICASEYIRRKNPRIWGDHPFDIGLWVGSKTTPNWLKDAEEALASLRDGKSVFEKNPIQLRNCPWCGEGLNHYDYHVDAEMGMTIRCPRPECEFHDNIPAYTVDEDIYRKCPSILIGTVDKFARLPLNQRMKAIFGRVDRHCPRHGFILPHEDHAGSHRPSKKGDKGVVTQKFERLLPPDLVIQDELHLISGPLGTMVGLYESAIDVLSQHNGKGPKIIASTATIRRANDQIKQLFARGMQQFPPSGLDASDSFFSKEESLEKKPGRLYVGAYLPGNSTQTNEINVYSTLLQAGFDRQETPEIDPYWTVIGYYNSLRELGGALRLFEDDIPDKLEYLKTKGKKRWIDNVEELTSRKSSDEIPKILAKMEKGKTTGKALDALLATNIISVGVDVDRIGLMVVNGQPKGTSEYIQSSSRVGRKHPGLVVTIYNWMRPRDISHYERFYSYHSMLYRYVEATSVTPFSPRARDKGLTAVFVGMLRQLYDDMGANKNAVLFKKDHALVDEILAGLKKRVDSIDPSEWDNVENELQLILEWWEQMVKTHDEELFFNRPPFRKREEVIPTLMHSINDKALFPGSKQVSDSLRDVEKEALVFYK